MRRFVFDSFKGFLSFGCEELYFLIFSLKIGIFFRVFFREIGGRVLVLRRYGRLFRS